jgi:hypothetical protein
MSRRLFISTVVLFVLLTVSVAAAGCLKGDTSAVGSQTGNAPALSEEQKDAIVEAETKTPEERGAACEALRYAEDVNTGSSFQANDVKVAGDWAHVAVEETGVPAEEAVSYGVLLVRQNDGSWMVTETGSGMAPDDIPGAPPEIFEL